MSNSFILSSLAKFWNFLVNIFENSKLYKIFNKKHDQSKSVIVRRLMDEDMSSNSKTYGILVSVFEKDRPERENTSVFLKALSHPLQTIILTILLSFALLSLAYLLKLFEVRTAFKVLVVLLLTTIFTAYVLKNKSYEGSLIYKFFSYAYRIEEDDKSGK